MSHSADHTIHNLLKDKRIFRLTLMTGAKQSQLFLVLLELVATVLQTASDNDKILQLLQILRNISFFDTIVVPNLTKFQTDEDVKDQDLAKITMQVLTVINSFAVQSPRLVAGFIWVHIIMRRLVSKLRENGLVDIESLQTSMNRLSAYTKAVTSANEAPVTTVYKPNDIVFQDDFRSISVYPRADEVTAMEPPPLRVNVTEGPYASLDDYLDIHYRLLREDLVGPLRDGILNYKIAQAEEWDEFQELRLFHNVTIKDSYCGKNGILHTLHFDETRFKDVEWEHSKWLMHGSLLCLSPDNFDTVLFATVLDRRSEEVAKGNINVSFVHSPQHVNEFAHSVFIMAESVAFFEAYKYVLIGLQKMFQFPFAKHIVECQQFVDPPLYLREDKSYDLLPLVDSGSLVKKSKDEQRLLGKEIVQEDNSTNEANLKRSYGTKHTDSSLPAIQQKQGVSTLVDVLDFTSWLSPEALHLNTSQYLAVQHALTREFVVLQGPPGTGKTYTGLRIVKTLLHNRNKWCKDYDSPMLIVCFTNHALDQFLEGITSCYNGMVVRVGGQCKSQKLSNYKLDVVRRTFRQEQGIPPDINDRLCGISATAEKMRIEIQRMRIEIRAAENSGTLPGEDTLRPFMGNMYQALQAGFYQFLYCEADHRKSLFEDGLCTSIIAEWLSCGTFTHENDVEFEQTFGHLIENIEMVEDSVSRRDDREGRGRYEEAFVPVPDIAHKMQEERMLDDDYDLMDINENTMNVEQDAKESQHAFAYSLSAGKPEIQENVHYLNINRPGIQEEAIQEDSEDLVDHSKVNISELESEKKSFTKISKGPMDFNLNVDNPEIDGEAIPEDSENLVDLNLLGDGMDWETEQMDTDKIRKARNTNENNIVDKKAERKHIIKQLLLSADFECREGLENGEDLWKLHIMDKLRLYKHWYSQYISDMKSRIAEIEDGYLICATELKVAIEEQDQYVLQHCGVIGITTTGAARYQSILQKIGPKIVIVEEAAQVLEAHIVTALSPACQHLILIGDHQQLRPTLAVHELAVNYNLDVSLFERMMKNGVAYDCLTLQHRMRPEISRLMRHIYPTLENHETTHEFEAIKGVSSSVFFINHSHAEADDPSQTSHWNEYEAEYMAALCRYLLQQGYDSSQITVLTTYSAQLLCLRKFMPKAEFEGVNVTVVDNFQGEESDIILLSLVRSNAKGNIGFMKIDNRVCVALSRGKKGLYVIGNFNIISTCSELWGKITESLDEANQIGNGLPLVCQNHGEWFIAETPADFKKSPEGGCMKTCDAQLKCGHTCRRYCHVDDPQHEAYRCMETCYKKCSKDHQCQDLCCEPECSPCQEKVEKIIPACGHTHIMNCSDKPEKFVCPNPCEVLLNCGHLCHKKCGEKHECDELKTEIRKCGHELQVPCEVKFRDRVVCEKPCQVILPCGHDCQNMCFDEHTESCQVPVIKKFPKCGHVKEIACHKNIESETCEQSRQKLLPCGHIVVFECAKDDTIKCKETISTKLTCGHVCDVMCGDRDTVQCAEKIETTLRCGHKVIASCHQRKEHLKCIAKCEAVLICGHKCAGNCTSCYRGKLHLQCNINILEAICAHPSSSPCSTCMPCQQPCLRSCPHFNCKKKCYKSCDICYAECDWDCPHYKCTKLCDEPCNRPPCNEPCPNPCSNCYLQPCIGLCGETCPEVCRGCDKTGDIQKASFGQAQDGHLKFIQLDCKHLVSVSFMDYWVHQHCNQMQKLEFPKFPTCPRCKAPAVSISRYQFYTKKAWQAIKAVKIQLKPRIKEKKPVFYRQRCFYSIQILKDNLSKQKSKMTDQNHSSCENALAEIKKWLTSQQKGEMSLQERLDAKQELSILDMMIKFYVYKYMAEQGKGLPLKLESVVKTVDNVLRSGTALGEDLSLVSMCVVELSNLVEVVNWKDIEMIDFDHVRADRYAMKNWRICEQGHAIWKFEMTENGQCPDCVRTALTTDGLLT